MNLRVSENGRRWALVGLCALAFVLRVWGLETQSLWRDEVDAIRFASGPWSDLLSMFLAPGQNGPLYFSLLRPWITLVGTTEFGLRFLSVSSGVLTIPLIYSLCQRLFPRILPLALVAALLAAASPYLVWYSQEGKMYALVVTLVLLSMDRFVAAVQKGGRRRWVVYVVVSAAALYVHLTVALVVLVQLVGYPLQANRRWRGTRTPWLVSVLLVGLAYLPLLVWEIPLLLGRASTGYNFVSLQDLVQTLLVSYSLGVVSPSALWLLAPFLCLLLAALLLKDNEAPGRSVALVVCWLVVPVVVFFGITLLRPMFAARYLVIVLPPYIVLLALGLVSVARRIRPLASLLLACLLVVSGWGLVQQFTMPIKTDLRAGTHHVLERMEQGDLLVFQIPHGRHAFEYYAESWAAGGEPREYVGDHRLFLPFVSGRGGEGYRWVDGLFTNAGMSTAAAGVRMEQLVGDAKEIWLIATEVALWDQRGLVRAWFDQHAELVERTDFTGVTIFQYSRE